MSAETSNARPASPPRSSRYPAIDVEACQLCARCLVQRACRWQAVLRFDRDEAPVIDTARCTSCWACGEACTFGAVIFPHSPAV